MTVMLSEVEYVTLTTDMWTSSCKTESYVAVTAHYVTKDWQLASVWLDCCRFVGAHTAPDIRNEIFAICRRWGVERKINAIVTDNAANMKAAVALLGWDWLPCLAHTLNLAVKDAINAVEHSRQKVKAIVEHFHRSTSASDKFEEMQNTIAESAASAAATVAGADAARIACGEHGTNTAYKLLNDVETRWNSTYAMFSRVCKVREPLVATIAILKQKKINLPTLDASEFDQLQELCRVLQPFESITTELSSENFVSGSKVLIVVRELMRLMTAFSNETGIMPETHSLATQLLDGLRSRFPVVEHNVTLSLPTYFDPRFKRCGITSGSALQKCKSEVQRLVTDMINDDVPSANHDDAIDYDTSSIWGRFDRQNDSYIASTTPSSTAIIEMRQYQEEPPIGRNQDPLEWWRKREVVYPRLAKLARKHLSLCATSVPSERVFSTAGEILTKKRNRLGSENFRKIMFLHGNEKLF